MRKMLKSMKPLQTALSAFALPAICLIGLSGCSGLRKFPAKYIYENDLKGGVCGQFEITATRPKLKFKHVKDLPASYCGGLFGFSSSDMPKVLDWADEAADHAERKCK